MATKPDQMIEFFTKIGNLKRTKRTGWVVRKVKDPESVSDHMYRMALMALVASDKDMRKDHCIKLCLVHDLAECIVGDIAPCHNISKEEKHKREKDAMDELCTMLGNEEMANELRDLFNEYEAQESAEAIFVKDLDRFEMILQAKNYEDEENKPGHLQEFFDGVRGKFKTSTVKELADALTTSRNVLVSSNSKTET